MRATKKQLVHHLLFSSFQLYASVLAKVPTMEARVSWLFCFHFKLKTFCYLFFAVYLQLFSELKFWLNILYIDIGDQCTYRVRNMTSSEIQVNFMLFICQCNGGRLGANFGVIYCMFGEYLCSLCSVQTQIESESVFVGRPSRTWRRQWNWTQTT